jgi:hypothetical protein
MAVGAGGEVAGAHAAADASGISSGRAGAISKSDAVAIDMIYFRDVTRVRWRTLGLGLDALRFGKAMTEGRAGGCSSHQPAFNNRLGSLVRRNLDFDDLRHEPTMPCRLAARLRGSFRICVFLCRFRADAESYRSREIPALASKRVTASP